MILNMVSDLLRSSPAKFGSVSMTYTDEAASVLSPYIDIAESKDRILCCRNIKSNKGVTSEEQEELKDEPPPSHHPEVNLVSE